MITSSASPNRRLRRAATIVGAGTVALTLVGTSLAPDAVADPPPKITICHATSATANPYNEIEVSQSSLDDGGHNDHSLHTGGVFDFTPGATNAGWGDIIPAFGDFAGLNWTVGGQAVLRAGCQAPAPAAVEDEDEGDDPDADPCAWDVALTADDPSCADPFEQADPDPCAWDPALTADDPTCTEPQPEPDPEPDPVVEPCAWDPALTADDPTCTEPQPDPDPEPDPVVEPCEADVTLASDDPACGAVLGGGESGEESGGTDGTDLTPPAPEQPGASSPQPVEIAEPEATPGAHAAPAPALRSLPRTGSDLVPLVGLALGLVLAGLTILHQVRVLQTARSSAPADRR